MPIRVNLVVGIDGSMTLNGSSRELSTGADRRRFHNLRKASAAILIGGNTARNEPYEVTPIPLYIVSQSNQIPKAIRNNENATVWAISPIEAVMRIQDTVGEEILIEGGAKLISELIEADVIDEIYLTQTNKSGGENQISIQEITSGFKEVSRELVGTDTFLHFIRER